MSEWFLEKNVYYNAIDFDMKSYAKGNREKSMQAM